GIGRLFRLRLGGGGRGGGGSRGRGLGGDVALAIAQQCPPQSYEECTGDEGGEQSRPTRTGPGSRRGWKVVRGALCTGHRCSVRPREQAFAVRVSVMATVRTSHRSFLSLPIRRTRQPRGSLCG